MTRSASGSVAAGGAWSIAKGRSTDGAAIVVDVDSLATTREAVNGAGTITRRATGDVFARSSPKALHPDAKMESFKDTVVEQYQAVKQLFRQPRMVRGGLRNPRRS